MGFSSDYEALVAVLLDKVTCAVFLTFEKWYGCVVKGLVI